MDDIFKEFRYVIEIQNIFWDLSEHNIENTIETLIPYFFKKNHQTNYYILKSFDKAIKYRPSILKFHLEFLDRLIPYIKESGISYEQLKYEIFSSSIEIKGKLKNVFEKNNVLDHSIEDDPLFDSIVNDDIDAFLSIVAQSNLDLNNLVINLGIKISHEMTLNNAKLIETAAYFGALRIFKYLWMNHVEINESVFEYAIAGGNYDIIHLIESKISISNVESVLFIAMKYNQKEIVDYLFNNYEISIDEAKIKDILLFDNLELFLEYHENEHFISSSQLQKGINGSLKNCNLPVFKYYLKKYWDYLLLDDLYYFLKSVIKARSFEMTKYLFESIEEHYKVETRDQNQNEGPYPSFDFAKILQITIKTCDLLKYFVEKKLINVNEDFLVDYSANSSIEVIKYIYNNFHFNEFNDGFTPFHSACDNGNFKAVKFFAEKNKNWVSSVDENGSLPIHYAAANDNTKVINYLVNDLKCDVNNKDCWGKTPLHLAVEKNLFHIVKVLIERKDIDLNIKAYRNGTPLEMAAVLGHHDIEKILRSRGGKYSIFANDCFLSIQIIYCIFFFLFF